MCHTQRSVCVCAFVRIWTTYIDYVIIVVHFTEFFVLSRLFLEIRKWHTIHVNSRLVTVKEKHEYFFEINYKKEIFFFRFITRKNESIVWHFYDFHAMNHNTWMYPFHFSIVKAEIHLYLSMGIHFKQWDRFSPTIRCLETKKSCYLDAHSLCVLFQIQVNL